MKKLLLFSVIIVHFGINSTDLQAQITVSPSIISSSGGYGENDEFSISWTLGELAITTLQGDNMVLTQGFLQPLDIETGIQKSEINWNISVYPNPVHNELNIQFDLQESNEFLFEIQDVTGRMIMQESHRNVTPGDIVILNMSCFASGVYFLRILTTDFQQVKVTSLSKL